MRKASIENEFYNLIIAEPGQSYAVVIQKLGNQFLKAICSDGETRHCHICGNMRNFFFRQSDFILISLRDFEDKKADVIGKYSKKEANFLINNGKIPSHLKIPYFKLIAKQNSPKKLNFSREFFLKSKSIDQISLSSSEKVIDLFTKSSTKKRDKERNKKSFSFYDNKQYKSNEGCIEKFESSTAGNLDSRYSNIKLSFGVEKKINEGENSIERNAYQNENTNAMIPIITSKLKEKRRELFIAAFPVRMYKKNEEMILAKKLAVAIGVPETEVKKATCLSNKTSDRPVETTKSKIIVEMKSVSAKIEMLRKKKKLWDFEEFKGVYINEYLTPSELRNLREERNQRNNELAQQTDTAIFNGRIVNTNDFDDKKKRFWAIRNNKLKLIESGSDKSDLFVDKFSLKKRKPNRFQRRLNLQMKKKFSRKYQNFTLNYIQKKCALIDFTKIKYFCSF